MLGHRLVGRQREIDDLTALLDRAAEGSGGALLISGTPGIGKTRLASEVADIASGRGFSVFWGRCWQGDMAPAFWPWVQVLRAMQPRATEAGEPMKDLLALIAPGAAPTTGALDVPVDGFLVVDRLATVLGEFAANAPTLVVIDDLQWADASSLQGFAHVAATSSASPLLVVATIRSTDEVRRAELTAMAHVVPRVDLDRLSDAEVTELLAIALGEAPQESLVDRVQRACGGNPFFVTALAEAARSTGGDAEVPVSVRAAVLAQVDPLGEGTRGVLQVASVLGREFSTADVVSIGDRDVPAVLDAAALSERAGLLRAQSFGARYIFVHDLVREAIYSSVPVGERALLHQRAADSLFGDDDFQVATRAHHALAAMPLVPVTEATALARAAGDRAARRLALGEAARWYRRAYDVATSAADVDPRMRAELLFAEGAALRGIQSPRSDDVLAEAANAAAALGDPDLLARIAVAWTFRNGGAGLTTASQPAWVLRALDSLPGHPTPLRVGVLSAAAIVRYEDPPAAWALLEQAAALLEVVDDGRARLEVALAELNLVTLLDVLGPAAVERAIDLSRVVEDRAAAVRDAGAYADAHFFRAEAATRAGDLATARRSVRSLEQAPFGSTAIAQIAASMHRAALDGLAGDPEAVQRALDPARRLAPAIDTTAGPVTLSELLHRYIIGRDPPTLLLAELQAFRSTHDPTHASIVMDFIGELAAALLAAEGGDHEPARASMGYATMYDGTAAGGVLVSMFLANMAALIGRPDVAEATYRFLRPGAGQLSYHGGIWVVCHSIDHLLGRCASTTGRVDDARRHYLDALKIEERVGAPHLLARTHLRLAELGVTEHLDACLALCEQHDLAHLGTAAAQLDRSTPAPTTGNANRLHREGDVWAVTFDDRTARLKDAKGLPLLARLLSSPGQEFHSLELAGAPELVNADGDIFALDATAKAAYRHRMVDLAEDLEEALSNNDLERAARAESEIDALTDQLAAAAGIGGRDRRTGAQSERARVAARRNLRAVIVRATEVHPSFGLHLQKTIRTGTFCSYQPDPRVPTAWIVD